MKPRDPERLRRLQARLEARRAARGQAAEPAVVVAPLGTLPDEYAAQLVAQGRQSPMLCVGQTPQTPEQIAAWEQSCAKYQAWLLSHGKRLADGADLSDGSLIREAYRASLTDAPMSD